MRDWHTSVPDTLFTDNSSEIMLKRVSNGATQKFTIKQWVGFSTVCNTWNAACGYPMNFYAVVKHPDSANDYYFHACNGATCHDGTYEAVGVDCHADYASNYAHTSSGGLTCAGANRSNCPAGRDPDLWGFGASSPAAAR